MTSKEYHDTIIAALKNYGAIPILGELDEETIEIVQPLIYHASNMGLDAIIFHITSYGGLLDTVTALESTCQALGLSTIGVAMGPVASAGALLLLGCDLRCATPSSSIMLHWGSISMGNIDFSSIMRQQRYNSEFLIRFWKERTEKILARCKLSREELAEAMDKERLFTAQEALECGLIDQIIESPIKVTVHIDEESCPEVPVES